MGVGREYEYTTDSYWIMEAYHIGRLSVLEHLMERNMGARKAHRKSSREILKYRTMALISEDREKRFDKS